MLKSLIIFIFVFVAGLMNGYSQKPLLRYGWMDIGNEDNKVYLNGKLMATQTTIYMKLYNPNEDDTKVWVKRFFRPVEYTKNRKQISTKGTVMALFDTNCKQKTLAVKEIIYYDKGDIIVKDIKVDAFDIEWEYVVPGSIGEIILEAACKVL